MAIKKISANLLANNAVHTANIASGAISAADIADNSITAAKISTSTFAIDSLTVNTSDLVVDTANNRVGIGTSSPGVLLDVWGSTPTIRAVGTSASNPSLTLSSAGITAWSQTVSGSDSSLSFNKDGSEKMRIDSSGNVGIGTNSPSSFNANRNNVVISDNSGAVGLTINSVDTTGSSIISFTDGATGTLAGEIHYVHDGDYMQFKTANTEHMRITSSGSVGIGYNVTSPVTTLEVSNTTNSQKLLSLFESQTAGRAVALGVTETGVGGNAAIYGTNTNGSTTTENLYINPDGGYVVLGKRPVASLNAKITADGNAAATTFRMSYDYGNATTGNRGANLDFQIGNDSGSATKITTNYWSGSGDINITAYGRTSPHLYLKSSTTDKVDSLGIGTSNPQAQLHIDASGTQNNTQDAHVYVNKNSSNDWTMKLAAGNDDYGLYLSGYGSNALYVYDYNASALKFRVTYSGVIYASNTTVQSISDERLKENIVDANSQWNDIKGLRFRNYNWIDNKYGDKTYLGLIAQELETVCPNLVEIDPQSKEDIDAGVPDPEYKTVNYSIVWMKSVKALQEAMERIEQLEAEVALLKGE